jgi:hypothetical protein
VTRAELAAKLEAKAKASSEVFRALLEQLAELPGSELEASDGRNLLDAIRERDTESQTLAMLAARERYWVEQEAKFPVPERPS